MISEGILQQAEAVLARLQAAKLTVATAESCTGGLVAASLTAVPGSSATVLAGFVTYANSAKTGLLGVGEDLLGRVGAVSEEVARAMAEGALTRAGADLAVSTTGIAGPGGAVPGKPVGTVWLALAQRGGDTVAQRHVFPGDRTEVRNAAVIEALRMLDRA